MKKLIVPVHILAFLFSMWAYYYFTFEKSAGTIITLGIFTYVILANLKRGEIQPSLWILAVFFLVKLSSHRLVYHFIGWNFEAAPYVLALEVFNYVLFSYFLFKFHCSGFLLRLARADIRRAFIPQSIAVSAILILSTVPFFIALCEVALYHFDNSLFAGPPFFYRKYESFEVASHNLIMLGVWSMMLDAHYLKERLQRKMLA